MTFNSWEFLVFYPITLLLYFLLPKKWSRISLLFMSAIFYLAWNYKLIVLIMFTTAVSYFCARIIEKNGEKSRQKAVYSGHADSVSRCAFLLQIL